MKKRQFRRKVFIRKRNCGTKPFSCKEFEEYIASVVKKRRLKSVRKDYDIDELLSGLDGEVLGRGNVYPIKRSERLSDFVRRLQKRNDFKASDKNAR